MWSPYTQMGSIAWYQKHAKPKMLFEILLILHSVFAVII